MAPPDPRFVAALANIERRLAIRRIAIAATIGAIVAAPTLVLAPGRFGAVIIVSAALAAAWITRRWQQRAARWLARQDKSEDLIVSTIAVVDGTARRTELADHVVTLGAAAAETTRPSLVFPSLLASASAVTLVLGLVSAISPSRDEAALRRAPRAAEATPATGPLDDSPAPPTHAEDAIAAVDNRSAPPAEREHRDAAHAERASGGAGSANEDDRQPGGVGSGASSSGSAEFRFTAGRVDAADPARTVETTARGAGAAASALAIPRRYRALVHAFLETR